MTEPSKKEHVPRITQLDAASLDKEISSIFKAEFEEIFRSTAPAFLTKFEPEIDAFLSLLIWKLSIYDNGATFGQSLLDLKFSKNSTRKRILFAAVVIGGKYMVTRCKNISRFANDENTYLLEQVFRWMDTGLRIANLANKVAFLFKGRYPSLPERVLDMPPVPSSNQHNRHIGYSYMTRELLWHSLIELLVFVIPLINYRAWYSKFATFFRPKTELGAPKPPILTLTTTCAVCNERPTLPQHINCTHIFCSYCLKGNLAANISFQCPLCGAPADGNVAPVII